MSGLDTALARRALPGIVESVPRGDGVRTWLENGIYEVDSSSTPTEIRLTRASLTDFVPYMTYDFERFSLASFETMAFCRTRTAWPRSLGWPLIKAYYAGFFGAHGLLRAIGRGVVRIAPDQARVLTDIGKIYCGDTFQVTGGNYATMVHQEVDRTIVITLLKLNDTGGAHDQFWRRFKIDLAMIIQEVARLNEPDADLVVARATELQAILDGRGRAGTWLPEMRNQINYQHLHRVWFPFGAAERDVTYVASIGYKASETARLDYDPIRQPLQAFAAASLFLAAVCYEVADQLIRSSVARRGIIRTQWLRLTTALADEIVPASHR